jgi:hypothetical protein
LGVTARLLLLRWTGNEREKGFPEGNGSLAGERYAGDGGNVEEYSPNDPAVETAGNRDPESAFADGSLSR